MGCQKISFETKSEALKHIKHIVSQRRFFKWGNGVKKSNQKLHAYNCLRCSKWHLTTEHRKHYKNRTRRWV